MTANQVLIALGSCIHLWTPLGKAQPCTNETELAVARASLEWSCDIDGDVAVVADSDDDENGFAAGAVWVFRFDDSEWIEEQKVLPLDGDLYQSFGKAVAVHRDVIAVGQGYYPDTVSVYVFRFVGDRWTQEQKLLEDGGVSSFGESVALSGDVLLVGDSNDYAAGIRAGSAFIFRYDGSTWSLEQKLFASDPVDDAYFGNEVALLGELAAISAPLDDDLGEFSGSVYLFRFQEESWVEQQKLTAFDGEPHHIFGTSVAVSESVVIASAWSDDSGGEDAGALYVFRDHGASWDFEQKLTASDAIAGANFGSSVAIFGENVVVGAPHDSNKAAYAGAVYTFGYDGSQWIEVTKLISDSTEIYLDFGTRLAVDGSSIIVGDVNGSASVFENVVFGVDCNDNCLSDSDDVASGTAPDCNLNGIPDECDVTELEFRDHCPALSPIGFGSPQSYTFASLPQAVGEVTFAFTAYADLFNLSEYITVYLNGSNLGEVFVAGAAMCPELADEDSIVLSADTFNELVATGDAVVDMIASTPVDAAVCNPYTYIIVELSYSVAAASKDLDRNGIPDECPSDCNHNGIPDTDDIATGGSADVDANGIPDDCQCLADVNQDGTVDPIDAGKVIAAIGLSDPSSLALFDVNHDGIIDPLDSGYVLSRFGECP